MPWVFSVGVVGVNNHSRRHRGGQSGGDKRQRKFSRKGDRTPGILLLTNQFQDSLECFSVIGRKTIEGQHLSRCFRDLLIRRSLPANSTVFPSPKQKEQQELSSRRVLVRFPYNPIHYIMHIRFDYVHNNAICEKKYEIVASITNVWG